MEGRAVSWEVWPCGERRRRQAGSRGLSVSVKPGHRQRDQGPWHSERDLQWGDGDEKLANQDDEMVTADRAEAGGGVSGKKVPGVRH